MKKNIFLKASAALMAVALMAACGSKDDGNNTTDPNGITLDKTTVSVEVDKTATVNITKGNGDYTVTSDKTSIATAAVSGTVITVTGVAKGSANVTVKDKENKTATLKVTVTDGGGDFTSAIKIDGSFSDWDALTEGEGLGKVTTFKTNAEATLTDLKVVKIYAEAAFLNFYFEFDKGVYKANGGGTVMHIFLDMDGENTGYINESVCPGSYFNYVMEGSITGWGATDLDLISYDPTLWIFADDAETQWFNWEDPAANGGSGFTVGGGVLGTETLKYEFQITREMLSIDLPSTINVFFDVQRSYEASGTLPIDADGAGYAYAWNIGSGS